METNNFETIEKEPCIKKVKLNTLHEIEVKYRSPVRIPESTKIVKSEDIAQLLRKVWSDNMDFCESFYLICLNRANRVLGWVKLSQGGLTGTVVDIRHIFSIALKSNAASIAVSHNHPSENSKPSEQDIQIPKKIKEAGRLLDIPLLDHIILTNENYYSFADEGNL